MWGCRQCPMVTLMSRSPYASVRLRSKVGTQLPPPRLRLGGRGARQLVGSQGTLSEGRCVECCRGSQMRGRGGAGAPHPPQGCGPMKTHLSFHTDPLLTRTFLSQSSCPILRLEPRRGRGDFPASALRCQRRAPAGCPSSPLSPASRWAGRGRVIDSWRGAEGGAPRLIGWRERGKECGAGFTHPAPALP